jgi:aryl-alcohol dehydrogenase-like predicted oxidoreductase
VQKKGFFGFGGGPKPVESPLAHAGTFAFLHRTNHWTAEAICLAYALTDPSVSSVMIEASDIERLNTLSQVPDRDMPPGLAAQIEMARVASAKAA